MSRQLAFYTKKKDYAYINRLIEKCNVREYWHFWSVTDLVYFVVIGSAKCMARFYYESERLRVGKEYEYEVTK